MCQKNIVMTRTIIDDDNDTSKYYMTIIYLDNIEQHHKSDGRDNEKPMWEQHPATVYLSKSLAFSSTRPSVNKDTSRASFDGDSAQNRESVLGSVRQRCASHFSVPMSIGRTTRIKNTCLVFTNPQKWSKHVQAKKPKGDQCLFI